MEYSMFFRHVVYASLAILRQYGAIVSVNTEDWISADQQYCWHPFTRQDDWVKGEPADPLVLVEGEGSWLVDSEGRRYIDGNASIWTNVHGHCHPVINAAIVDQLSKVAHTSYLGFANPRASELARNLCAMFPPKTLERVFFSDDGSTAVECALKMEIQYRIQQGQPERVHFIAFDQAYHGTAGPRGKSDPPMAGGNACPTQNVV
jgi:adenosylmethionine-8-amino-7-oxononanoate aminotransferase